MSALGLADEQLRAVMDAARTFAPLARSRLLAMVAARLPSAPADGDRAGRRARGAGGVHTRSTGVLTMSRAMPRWRHSRLRDECDEFDGRVGGWSREQLIAMDARFCEAMRKAHGAPAEPAASDEVASCVRRRWR